MLDKESSYYVLPVPHGSEAVYHFVQLFPKHYPFDAYNHVTLLDPASLFAVLFSTSFCLPPASTCPVNTGLLMVLLQTSPLHTLPPYLVLPSAFNPGHPHPALFLPHTRCTPWEGVSTCSLVILVKKSGTHGHFNLVFSLKLWNIAFCHLLSSQPLINICWKHI